MPSRKFRLCLCAALLSVPSSAFSANKGPGYVAEFSVQNGVLIFNLTGTTPSGWPACANTLKRYAFVTTTAAGQAWYAAVLSAKLSNRQLTVYGAGNCSAWPDSEAVTYLTVED